MDNVLLRDRELVQRNSCTRGNQPLFYQLLHCYSWSEVAKMYEASKTVLRRDLVLVEKVHF